MERENKANEIERANQMGAKEDFVHVSERKEGDDLRNAREVGLKQFHQE